MQQAGKGQTLGCTPTESSPLYPKLAKLTEAFICTSPSMPIANLYLLQPCQEQSSQHLHTINHPVNLVKIRLSAQSFSKEVRKIVESTALSFVSSSYPPLNFPSLWQENSEVSSMTLWTDLYKTVTQSALTYWQRCISCKQL